MKTILCKARNGTVGSETAQAKPELMLSDDGVCFFPAAHINPPRPQDGS